MKLVWLVPGDAGGGIIWVADSCCRQAVAHGHDVTMLTMTPLSPTTMARVTYKVECMHETPPYTDTPKHFVDWVTANSPDIVFINGCDTMDTCAPFLPPRTRCVYVVHDTPSFYWKAAVAFEASFDAIVAVSDVTASVFRNRLKLPEKLHVIHNGTQFPPPPADVTERRAPDICFLGGESPRKGAYDVLSIWNSLIGIGYSGRLHWFGELNDAFEAKINRLPARDRIIVHGHRTRTELFQTLGGCSTILVPSRSEAFGLVLIEGMSMGCTPVTWQVEDTATNEIVAPKFRFSAPLGDFAAASRATLRAIEAQPTICRAMTEDVRSRFSEEAMWTGYQKLITDLSVQATVLRPRVGDEVPPYKLPRRASQMIPKPIWAFLRPRIARSAHLYRALRRRM